MDLIRYITVRLGAAHKLRNPFRGEGDSNLYDVRVFSYHQIKNYLDYCLREVVLISNDTIIYVTKLPIVILR